MLGESAAATAEEAASTAAEVLAEGASEAAPEATPACVDAVCKYFCNAPYADCNRDGADGCEVNVESDPVNCGGCGKSCEVVNGIRACDHGACGTLTCMAGYSDCDANPKNGCETIGSCPTPPPPVESIVAAPTNVPVGEPHTYAATVQSFTPRPLTLTWSEVSGPGTVQFGTPNALQTTAIFSAPGTYVLQFEADDGVQPSSIQVTITAILVNHPPVVNVGPSQSIAGATATLTATASDDGNPSGATLTATWTLLSGPADVTFGTPVQTFHEPGPATLTTGVAFNYPGTYLFELDVTDGELTSSGQTTVVFTVPASTSGGAPVLAFGSGLTDDLLITQPTPIVATIGDGAWRVDYRLGGRDDVETPYTVLASGIGARTNATLATFDPTLLLNGLYTLRLSSISSAGETSVTIAVEVDGRMKVGNFTLAFTDLDVAVSGVPLQLIRTYDSRDKRLGDFGIGWNLAVRDVRVEKSGKTGAYWSVTADNSGFFPVFCLAPSQSTMVTITFPNGREYRFKPAPQCTILQIPDPSLITWTCVSDPDSPAVSLTASGAEGTFVAANFEKSQILNLSDNEPWDPRSFTLTTEDGTVYEISQDGGVTKVTDRDHNTLTINASGIFSSLGPSVPFTRDELGRITTITDPNGKAMTYGFDTHGDLTSFTDRAANITTFTYVANHYLKDIFDPLGRRPIRNDYDDSGRLLDQIDALGNQVTYSPDLPNNLEQVTDRLGRVTQYKYNQNGDITLKIDPSGAQWASTYDQYGNTLTSTDPLGNKTTSTYDGARHLLTRMDPLGRTTTYTYDQYGDVLTTTDPLGRVTKNTYDAFGNPASTTYPAAPFANVVNYVYDDAGNKVRETDALAATTMYVYEPSAHRLASITDAQNVTTTYTYDANGKKTSESHPQTDFNGGGWTPVRTYAYDALGRLTQATAPTDVVGHNATRTTTYTATGKVASTIDEIGRVTSYTYDELDRLVATTRPDGTVETQTYDAEGQRTSSTDAAGNTTRYAYDPVGRLTRTIYADGTATNTAYDAAGRAIESIDAQGHVRWSSYDAAGQLVSTTDATGATTSYVYDAAGNQTQSIDPLGHVTQTAYDAMNRPATVTHPDGSTDVTRYDVLGRVTSKIDALAHTTEFDYDSLGRLADVYDAAGHTTSYRYNTEGVRTGQKDANGRWTIFSEGRSGRMVGRTLPGGATESKVYDDAGQVLERHDFSGQVTKYTYDPMGRVKTRSYPDGSVVSFTYTPDGRRMSATDARGTTVYAYDSRRRLALVTMPDATSLSYGYDNDGNRTTLTATVGGQSLTTTTAYDADERAETVTDPMGRSFGVQYDAASRRSELDYPNGIATTYGYDANNRLRNLTTTAHPTNQPASTVQSYAYTLDAAGKRTNIVEADGTTRQYGYDSIDRLTSEIVEGGAIAYAKTFSYDAVGNRMQQVTTGAGAASVPYTYDQRDEMLTAGSTSFAYDTNGNEITRSGEAGYGYDFENRLTQAHLTDGSNVAYDYDVDGNRVRTTVAGPPTNAPATACSDNAASFVRFDESTHGNWQGVYGADGNAIAQETAVQPTYGSATFAGGTPFTWAASTTDARALLVPGSTTARIASANVSFTSQTVHVATTDGNAHTVALYFLDWDSLGRTQTVTAQTSGGAVLDAARPVAGFEGGMYAVYTVCGAVDFVVTSTHGGDPIHPRDGVVSGVFFGPAMAAGAQSVTGYLVDGSGGLSQVVEETDGAGALTAYYVRVGDELLEVMRPGGSAGMWTNRFVHRDGLGSVRAITDEGGTVVDARGYEAFGAKNAETGGDALVFGFAGEPLDSTTQLAYHRARWLDSKAGRFVGMDPLSGSAEENARNAYVYGNNSPATVVDPTGWDGMDALPNYTAQFRQIVGHSIGSGGSGPPYAGIEYPDLESAEFAAFRMAETRSAVSETFDPGQSDPLSNTALHEEWGGDVFILPKRAKFGIDVYTDHKGGALDLFEGIRRIPSDAIARTFFHTHPNYGSYSDVTSKSHDWHPHNWSCQDQLFRNRLFGSGLAAFEVDILAFSPGSGFLGMPVGQPHWEKSSWPSWASEPDRFSLSTAPTNGECGDD